MMYYYFYILLELIFYKFVKNIWIYVDVWQKTAKFCKAVIFQLKNK